LRSNEISELLNSNLIETLSLRKRKIIENSWNKQRKRARIRCNPRVCTYIENK